MPYGEKSAYAAQATLKKKSPAYKKSIGFKMISPLKHPTHESHHKKRTTKPTNPDRFKGMKKEDIIQLL